MISDELRQQTSVVEQIVGKQVIGLSRIDRGHTPAFRARVVFDDRSSAFVKAGTNVETNDWLRVELQIYRQLSHPVLPKLLACAERPDFCLMVLEDLTSAYWPPPWQSDQIEAVKEAIASYQSIAGMTLPSLETIEPLRNGWEAIAQQPAPFLSLGIASERWLELNIDRLRSIDGEVLAGGALVHADIRSDNLCFLRGAVKIVDWNWAHYGNPRFDVASWLPSLAMEGGPLPWEVMPKTGGISVLLAGFFGSRAGLPAPERAPHVRALQLGQLRFALPWAARELQVPLPEPTSLRS